MGYRMLHLLISPALLSLIDLLCNKHTVGWLAGWAPDKRLLCSSSGLNAAACTSRCLVPACMPVMRL